MTASFVICDEQQVHDMIGIGCVGKAVLNQQIGFELKCKCVNDEALHSSDE